MSDTTNRRVDSKRATTAHSCEQMFNLMCPLKNAQWVPGWRENCEMVYSRSGVAEPGCVFRITNQPYVMGSAVVVNTRYQPHEKIRYTAVNEHLVYHIQWELKPFQSGCEVVVTRTWTALSAKARVFLESMDSTADHPLRDLLRRAEYYLSTGKMMAGKSD